MFIEGICFHITKLLNVVSKNTIRGQIGFTEKGSVSPVQRREISCYSTKDKSPNKL